MIRKDAEYPTIGLCNCGVIKKIKIPDPIKRSGHPKADIINDKNSNRLDNLDTSELLIIFTSTCS